MRLCLASHVLGQELMYDCCVCVCVWLQARPPKVRGPTMSPYTVLVPARVLELDQEGTAGRACTLRRRPL